ncbi:MAG: tetraacyldisaccharide 4'-kinase [Halanaerobiales bacterium]
MRNSLENYLLQVVSGRQKGLLPRLTLFLLFILEKIYIGIILVRSLLYRFNFFKQSSLKDCQVISIGNITVGGTGKTPIVKLLAEEYKKRGLKIVIVSRGYKSSDSQPRIVSNGSKRLLDIEEAGDEALMLSKLLSDVPVVIGTDRYEAGKLAVREFNPDVILLDDAFQHRQLERDKDIVLIDATNPFGYRHLLPRGLLREPLKSLSRADLFIITKVNGISQEKVKQICKTLRRYNSRADIFTAEYRSINIILHSCLGMTKKDMTKKNIIKYNTELKSVEYLQDKHVIAFSGIGNPVSFEKSLLECGADLIKHMQFSDHHKYTESDIYDICDLIKNKKIDLVVTTEKDAVKLDERLISMITNNTDLAELVVAMDIENIDCFIDESLKKDIT